MNNSEKIMKIINDNEVAWQLENGLWYEKESQWGGICPKCGTIGGICYHVWRKEYFVCKECMVSCDFGSDLSSAWRYMTDDDFISNLEFLRETEDMISVYSSFPITKETSKMLDDLRKKERDALAFYDKNNALIEGEANGNN